MSISTIRKFILIALAVVIIIIMTIVSAAIVSGGTDTSGASKTAVDVVEDKVDTAEPEPVAQPQDLDGEYIDTLMNSNHSDYFAGWSEESLLRSAETICNSLDSDRPYIEVEEEVYYAEDETTWAQATYEVDVAVTTYCPEYAQGRTSYIDYLDAAPTVFEPEPVGPSMSSAERNAYEKGLSYLDGQAFSFESLKDQLQYEGYGPGVTHVAVTAIQDQGLVNWKAEAVEKARSYLDGQSFSRSGLLDQLLYEGFTPEQAEHGVNVAY